MRTEMIIHKNRIYKVYLITNLINKKIYVGRTYKELLERFDEHIEKAHDNTKKYPINFAIRKYGKNNFRIELIETTDTLLECKKKETFYILKLESYKPKIGYNLKIEDPEKYYCDKTLRKMRLSTQKAYGLSQNKTGYRGIRTFIYKNNTIVYGAAIYYKNEKAYSKTFKNINDAVEWYDRLAIYLYGQQAFINKEKYREEYINTNTKEKIAQLLTKNKRKETKFKGAHFSENNKKFTCKLTFKRKSYHFGYYDTEIDAAIMYDKMSVYLNKSINFLNFPNKIEEYQKDLQNIKQLFIYYTTEFSNRIRNKNGFRGVFYDKKKPIKRFFGRIELKGRVILSEFFDNTKDAAVAYDKLAVRYFGNRAKTNFSIENYKEEINCYNSKNPAML